MRRYPSIPNLYKRDQETHKLIVGEYSMPEFEFLKDLTWRFYEKIDGTNIRIMWDGHELRFGGRTDKAQMHGGLLSQLSDLHGTFTPDAMKRAFPNLELGTGVCIYGEGFGLGIQKGGGYCEDGESQKFAAFDIKIGHWWLTQDAVTEICEKLGCLRAPQVGVGDLRDAAIIGSSPFPSAFGDRDVEGIVCRPAVDLQRRNGDRVICKIKWKDFQ